MQTQCGSVQQQVREECVLVDLFAHAAPLRCDCTDALVPLPFNSLRPLEATYCPLFVGSIPGAEHLDKCRHVLATHALGCTCAMCLILHGIGRMAALQVFRSGLRVDRTGTMRLPLSLEQRA